MFVWKFRIESFSLFEYFDIAKFNIEALPQLSEIIFYNKTKYSKWYLS